MSFSIPIAISAIQFFCLIARVTGFLAGLPFIGNTQIQARYRVMLAVSMAAVLLPVLPENWQNSAFEDKTGFLDLFILMVSEAGFGLTVSLIVSCFIEIFVFAGAILGRNMGYFRAKVVDPSSQVRGIVISAYFTQVFIVMFFITDAHHGALRFLVWSLHEIPPGAFIPDETLKSSVIELSNMLFKKGVQIALPAFIVTLFVHVALAFMAKIGQEFNVLFLSFPIRMALGQFMLFLIVPITVYVAGQLNENMIEWLSTLAPS